MRVLLCCSVHVGALNSERAVTLAQSTVLAVCSHTKAAIAVTSPLTTQTTESLPDLPTASAAATSRSAPSCVKSITTANANSSGSVTLQQLSQDSKLLVKLSPLVVILMCSKCVQYDAAVDDDEMICSDLRLHC